MAKREIKAKVEQDEGVKALPELGEGFAEIKNLFKAGAVPRQLDYERLIEYVHYLHKLLGVEGEEEAHEPALGHGLTTSEEGVLCVDAKALVGASMITYGDNKLSFGAVGAAGAGLIGDHAVLSFNASAVAAEGSGLSGVGSSLSFNALEVAGSGLSGAGSQLTFDAEAVAGSGLTVANNTLNVNTDALRLSTVSWFYEQMSRFKATHFALAPIDDNNTVPKVSDAHFILFFTPTKNIYVRVRGFATGPNIFDYAPILDNWKWGDDVPENNMGWVYVDNFSLLYPDINDIGGSIKIYIVFKLDGTASTVEKTCLITKLTDEVVIN